MAQKTEPLSARVRRLREAKGWSARELARRIGVAQMTVAKLEAGSDPAWSIVQRLAEAFGVSTEDLRCLT